ncbi:MarR family transcriptional regulator, partial [Listeria monocytogenes]|nr:MarR family transcriptional regulator [Listeria monocytogenes]
LADALKKVKENIADDWLYVKKGSKRSY